MFALGAAQRRPENRLGIRLLQAVGVCIARIFHQVHVLAPPRLPHNGAAVLVCNHTSGLDPILVQAVCSRLIVWMMAKEYYDVRLLNWVFRTIEAIPVERSGRDMAATRAALRALQNGRVLGIFPEGRIEKAPQLLPFQTGVALLAIKSGAPVYPAYLDGTQRNKEMLPAFAHPNRAYLCFGPEVKIARDSTDREALERVTQQIQDAVEALKDQMQRRLPHRTFLRPTD